METLIKAVVVWFAVMSLIWALLAVYPLVELFNTINAALSTVYSQTGMK